MDNKDIQFKYDEDNNEDFIGTYYNILSEDKCNELIDHFENILDRPNFHDSFAFGNDQMPQKDMSRKDASLNILGENRDFILNKLNECYDEYKGVYFPSKSLNVVSPHVKMQRTPPRGGYHIWHAELGDISAIHRALAWIIYLNDIPDGEGETEFLWQKRRVKPEVGKCIIWPAHFTHHHRGNPVYSKCKYIVTGWFVYEDVYNGSSNSEWFYDVKEDSTFRKVDEPEKYSRIYKGHKFK
jgi:hypothetical protein